MLYTDLFSVTFLIHHSTHFCTCQKNNLILVFITYLLSRSHCFKPHSPKYHRQKLSQERLCKNIYITPFSVYISKSSEILTHCREYLTWNWNKKPFKLFMYNDSAQFWLLIYHNKNLIPSNWNQKFRFSGAVVPGITLNLWQLQWICFIRKELSNVYCSEPCFWITYHKLKWELSCVHCVWDLEFLSLFTVDGISLVFFPQRKTQNMWIDVNKIVL